MVLLTNTIITNDCQTPSGQTQEDKLQQRTDGYGRRVLEREYFLDYTATTSTTDK